MEMIYFTVAAVILYLVSDYILNAIEMRMGKRLPSRSFFFLIIISILTMVSFSFIRAIYGPLPNKNTPDTKIEQPQKSPAPISQQVPAVKETKK